MCDDYFYIQDLTGFHTRPVYYCDFYLEGRFLVTVNLKSSTLGRRG